MAAPVRAGWASFPAFPAFRPRKAVWPVPSNTLWGINHRFPRFDSAAIGELFGIMRSRCTKGCPCDNAIVESTNKIQKAEFAYRKRFESLYELQAKLSDQVVVQLRVDTLKAKLDEPGRIQGKVPPDSVYPI